VVHACDPIYAEGLGRRTVIWDQPQAKTMRPYLKNNWSIKGMPQVIKHLPSKYEALSSNPCAPKDREREMLETATASFKSQ
jgi:hypothetical protein